MTERQFVSGLVPSQRHDEGRVATRQRLVARTRTFLLDTDPDMDWAEANERAMALVDLVAHEVPAVVSL